MSKSPTWRDGMIAAAASARTRMQTALESSRAFPHNKAEHQAHACALEWLASELAYLASLPPHEGLAKMRALGTPETREWAAEFARTGYQPRDPNALTPEELTLVRTSEIIGAIKLVRARTGLGLMDAKKIIDANR